MSLEQIIERYTSESGSKNDDKGVYASVVPQKITEMFLMRDFHGIVLAKRDVNFNGLRSEEALIIILSYLDCRMFKKVKQLAGVFKEKSHIFIDLMIVASIALGEINDEVVKRCDFIRWDALGFVKKSDNPPSDYQSFKIAISAAAKELNDVYKKFMNHAVLKLALHYIMPLVLARFFQMFSRLYSSVSFTQLEKDFGLSSDSTKCLEDSILSGQIQCRFDAVNKYVYLSTGNSSEISDLYAELSGLYYKFT